MNARIDTNLIQQVSGIISDMLGDDFDVETFWDTLDGETDVMDIIGHLVSERVEASAYEAASKDMAATYSARASRMNAKRVAINKALGAVLDATSQAKVGHPLATVSRTKPRMGLHITDPDEIPSQLTVTSVVPDKAAIKKLVEAGEVVPGAELRAGDAGISVRIK